jgi:hypothetical protein
MTYSKLSVFLLAVVLLTGSASAQSSAIRSTHFGGELSYGYCRSHELDLGINMVSTPNLNRKTGGVYTFSYNGLGYFKDRSVHFGQRLSFDLGIWRSEMKIGVLPHVGAFIETREAFTVYGGVSCGISILDLICLHYRYTFNGHQSDFPISNHALSLIIRLNFTSFDLAWYNTRAASGKR